MRRFFLRGRGGLADRRTAAFHRDLPTENFYTKRVDYLCFIRFDGIMDNVIETYESDLKEMIGCSRKKLIGLRKDATPGVHWGHRKSDVEGRPDAVVWYREGVEWLKAKIGDWEAPEGIQVSEDGVWGEIRKMPLNSKLLVVEINGKPEKVLTRDQKLFKIGMRIPIKELTGGIFAVSRYPRPNGRY